MSDDADQALSLNSSSGPLISTFDVRHPMPAAFWGGRNHGFVRPIIMQPDFGQARAKLPCEIDHRRLRARFGSCSGFLSPPAPRGADGPGHSFGCDCFYVTAIHPLSFRPASLRPFDIGEGDQRLETGFRSQRIPPCHLTSVSAAPRMIPGRSWLPSCTMIATASMPSALICAMGRFQLDCVALSAPSLSQLRTTLW